MKLHTCPSAILYSCHGKEDVNYIVLTDKESSLNNSVDIDLDQETTTNTNQVESSSIHLDHNFDVHLNDISPVLNKQKDIDHDVNSTSDDSSTKITLNNSSKVAFTVDSNESNLSHQRSMSQNNNTEDIPRKQYRSPSIALTKSHALCCKLSIVVAICCTTGCSLLPIVLYYVSQFGKCAHRS